MNQAIIVCGAPGAGKTTYGRRLAAKLGAVFLDIDMATERLVRTGLALAGKDPDDRDSPDFKQAYRQPIYEQLFDIAADNLPIHPVVITGPFTREIGNPGWPRWLVQRLNAPVAVHHVACPPKVRKERLLARANDRDRAKLADWDSFIQYYGEEAPPRFDHVSVDGDAPLA